MNLVAVPMPGAFFVALPLAIALLSWNMVQIFKRTKHYTIRTFLLIWLSTYFIFFLWWLPGEPEFFIVTVFPLLLLIFMTLKDVSDMFVDAHSSKKIVGVVGAGLIVVLVTVNSKDIAKLHQSRGSAYREASDLAMLVPQECMIVADYRVQQNLIYYFERQKIIEVQLPLLLFYQQKSLPEREQLNKEQCIIVPLVYVTPEYTYSGFNAYNHPSEWIEFIKWLFDIEYSSTHTMTSVRRFEVITLQEERTYLLLSSSRIEMKGLHELFQVLDNHIGQRLGIEVGPYRSWLSTVDLISE